LRVSVFVGEFAREQLAQQVGNGPSAREGGDLDAARCSGVTSKVSRAVKSLASGSREDRASRVRTHVSASLGRAAKARLAGRRLIA
jgi:hypothetical protein